MTASDTTPAREHEASGTAARVTARTVRTASGVTTIYSVDGSPARSVDEVEALLRGGRR